MRTVCRDWDAGAYTNCKYKWYILRRQIEWMNKNMKTKPSPYHNCSVIQNDTRPFSHRCCAFLSIFALVFLLLFLLMHIYPRQVFFASILYLYRRIGHYNSTGPGQRSAYLFYSIICSELSDRSPGVGRKVLFDASGINGIVSMCISLGIGVWVSE